MIPGEIIRRRRSRRDLEAECRVCETRTLEVANTGDRPIQVGSHFHFYEVNTALPLRSRSRARLSAQHSRRHRRALRAGRHRGSRSSSRFAGTREVFGLNNKVNGTAMTS